MYIRSFLLLLFGAGLAVPVWAQRAFDGQPYSLTHPRRVAPLPDPVQLPTLAFERLSREDERSPGFPRFAAPTLVDLGLEKDGQWEELPNGDRLWRLYLRAEKALGLALFYDILDLPEGSSLYMYSPNGQQILGEYRTESFRRPGRQWTGFLAGQEAVLEYYEPAAVRGQGRIHLFRIDQAYRASLFQPNPAARMFGFGAANDCHVNINCPQGQILADASRGVCRIIVVVEEGTGYCSGSLINNTSEDGTPYTLTAFHCADGFTPLWDLWRFDFEFEGPDCDHPPQAPDIVSFTGCTLRAGWRDSDFLLLEMLQPIPFQYDFFFNGWNRSPGAPNRVWTIHHPRGDIKKLSLDTNSVTIHQDSIDWNNDVVTPPGHHFRTIYDLGSFEPGSSGGPLLDTGRLIIGQFNGGFPSCASSVGYFGRLAISWDGGGTPDTRLKDWLDPAGSGVLQLAGSENPNQFNAFLSGFVRDPTGRGIGLVEVHLSGFSDTTVTTLSDGYFEFSGLTFEEDYEITLYKDTNDINGVSTLDIILAQRHVLAIEDLDSPYKVLAGDVNASGSLSVSDFFRLRRLILGIDVEFPDKPSWEFIPADVQLSDMPLNDPIPGSVLLPNLSENKPALDFIGIKTGDLNWSADPEQ